MCMCMCMCMGVYVYVYVYVFVYVHVHVHVYVYVYRYVCMYALVCNASFASRPKRSEVPFSPRPIFLILSLVTASKFDFSGPSSA